MMVLFGQSNRIWHYWCGKYPGSVGILYGPSYGSKVPLDPWMPFALDNDAFTSWTKKTEWDEQKWINMLENIKTRKLTPLWVLVPDVVANKEATIASWHKYYPIASKFKWPLAFALQDGMLPSDVPENADIVFVGGTTKWKLKTIPMWTRNFKRVHVGRVNTGTRLEICERYGVESVDGTGWFRGTLEGKQAKQLERFIMGIRCTNMEFDYKDIEFNPLLQNQSLPPAIA